MLIETNTFFIQENAFENVVWKMAAICLGLNVLRMPLPPSWDLAMHK